MSLPRPLSHFYETERSTPEVTQLRINAAGATLLISLALVLLDQLTGSSVLRLHAPSAEQQARAALVQKFAPLPDSGWKANSTRADAALVAEGGHCSNC